MRSPALADARAKWQINAIGALALMGALVLVRQMVLAPDRRAANLSGWNQVRTASAGERKRCCMIFSFLSF